MKASVVAIVLTLLFLGCSQEDKVQKSADTLIVEKEIKKSPNKNEALICIDEDETITCKLVTERLNVKRTVLFEWRSPKGNDDRKRDMILPKGHASIYDARSKKGREKGKWIVEVALDDETVTTSFIIN